MKRYTLKSVMTPSKHGEWVQYKDIEREEKYKFESSECACNHGKCRLPEPDCNVWVGFKDNNGRDLRVGQRCSTHDRTGKKWIGKICKLDQTNGGILYGFETNYKTVIHNQEYASTLEIL